MDYFEMLLEIYQESENGEKLYKLFQDDWEIFLNEQIAYNLISIAVPYSKNKKYCRKVKTDLVSNLWESFKEEIKHNNRFFPKFQSFQLDHFKEWLRELKNENLKKRFLYRARISDDKQLIPKENMGKPPAKLIKSGGRANPVGISYLYTATNKKTAIAEVRPHKGEVITIAKIKIIKKLILADLRNPRLDTSPFAIPNMQIDEIFKYINLLQHFSKELSKPVVPKEAYLEYLPTQYLSELIKDIGYDGFIFKSSVANGDNIVLFSEDKIKIDNIELYSIDNITFNAVTKNE
ncbi:RES family NAD+ phosphorylase [Hydrogenimonas thermophila]|uniref:RES family NAD+ phosphorylase n=1 Tax=Hydrogenimonas thermophila TaxID=223786 RepID=UPI00293749BD|nr:RES family NAD+ phosphorylase [Hydrogenimonas thermophila]WOE70672.1 RES family NAD+ phosphorylase [Hydrogenimonas thermophila]WOE73190.1 RES family NAD+ phosphorylase [Hydrogenimonas thermophila]